MDAVCDLCTACGACAYKCPKSAISFRLNERREYIASIDESKCINCQLCVNICPQLSGPSLFKPIETYCAWTKDAFDYQTTSSGGVGTLLAKSVLDMDGVVYGASFINGSVKHIRINSVDNLELIKGSKYVQSDFKDVYSQLKEDIHTNHFVAIIGVPCQIAAIRNAFNQQELNKVILIDLVCHGTPPEAYLKDYLNSILDNTCDNIDVTFRKKSYKLCVYSNSALVYSKKYEIEPYYRSFMYGLTLRENCYSCQYSKKERIGDLTICDFWGINRDNSALNIPDYVSCVLCNNSKGQKVFDNIKSDCWYESRSLNEAISGNDNLQRPSLKHPDRSVFINGIINNESFLDSVNKTSIRKDIIKCIIMDVLKAPYRLLKYGPSYYKDL